MPLEKLKLLFEDDDASFLGRNSKIDKTVSSSILNWNVKKIFLRFWDIRKFITLAHTDAYIVGCRGASQLGGSLLGDPTGYKANKLKESLSYPVGIIRTLVWR